ncbi:hypothetical protein ACT4MK_22165 [Bradyrhizobium barranii]|uniref:hypothetical protein n=1 Tax=Bradyrhizobium barranii TaxID=2992140 RepID=UPI0040331D3F
MNEAEAKKIAVAFAAGFGLSPRRGTVFIKLRDDGDFELLVSADSSWLASHPLPQSYRGLAVVPSDRIVGHAHKVRAFA